MRINHGKPNNESSFEGIEIPNGEVRIHAVRDAERNVLGIFGCPGSVRLIVPMISGMVLIVIIIILEYSAAGAMLLSDYLSNSPWRWLLYFICVVVIEWRILKAFIYEPPNPINVLKNNGIEGWYILSGKPRKTIPLDKLQFKVLLGDHAHDSVVFFLSDSVKNSFSLPEFTQSEALFIKALVERELSIKAKNLSN